MPARPGAEYSGTPVPRKLGIRPGARVVLSGAPPGAEALLGDLPDGVREMGLAAGPVDNRVCAIDATWSGLRLVARGVRDR